MTTEKQKKAMKLTTDDELEKYGVWVKSGPIDVVEEEELGKDFNLSDLEEPEPMTTLTEEEEELLGKLEKDFDDAGSVTEEELGPISFDEEEELNIPEEESIGLDEESDLELPEEKQESAEEDFLNMDIDMDQSIEESDIEQEASPEDELSLDSLPDIEDIPDESEESLEESALEGASISATLPTAEEEMEEIDIEELSQSDYGEELPELEVDEKEEPSLGESESPEEEMLQLEEPELEEPQDLDSFLSEQAETEEPELNEAIIEEESMEEFDDIKALEEDLRQPTAAPKREEVGETKKMDTSTEILLKIEQELLSIKNELTSLKQELSNLRFEPKADQQQEPEKEETQGFFEEDEDETIALTGDELDNILNTADITEETGEASLPEDQDVFEPGVQEENLVEKEDIISLEEPAPSHAAEAKTKQEADVRTEDKLEELDVDQLILDEEPGAEKAEDIEQQEETPSLELEENLEIGEPAEQTEEPAIEEIDISDQGLNLEDEVLEEPKEEELVLPEEEEEISVPSELELEPMETETPSPATEEEISIEIEEEPQQEEIIDEIEIDIPGTAETEQEAEEEIVIEKEPTEEPEIAIEKTHEEPEISIEEEEIAEKPVVSKPEISEKPEVPVVQEKAEQAAEPSEPEKGEGIPGTLKEEIKAVLAYMDQLLESLPEEKIQEFARSEHFEVYKKLFEELGLT